MLLKFRLTIPGTLPAWEEEEGQLTTALELVPQSAVHGARQQSMSRRMKTRIAHIQGALGGWLEHEGVQGWMVVPSAITFP